MLLRREGWVVNRKRVRRLYRLDGLQLRMRVRRRKHMALHRGPAPVPTGPTERWSMDFVHDALADGRPFRVLTVVDQWSRSSPVLEVASRMRGVDRIGRYLSILRGLDLARRSDQGDVAALLEEAEEVRQALPPDVEPVIFAAVLGNRCPHGHDVTELRVRHRSAKDAARRRSWARVDCLACQRERWDRKQRRRRGRPMTRHEVALRANAVRWARARAG